MYLSVSRCTIESCGSVLCIDIILLFEQTYLTVCEGYIHMLYRDEHQLEWEEMVKGREAKQREIERARQELETRQRIEARVKARLEQAEAKAKKEEEVKGVCVCVWVGG